MTVDCPKQMTYGPCGGVAPDGGCEVPGEPNEPGAPSEAGRRCVFVDEPVVRWPDAVARPAVLSSTSSPSSSSSSTSSSSTGSRLADALGTPADRPVVIADLPARALDVDSLRRSAGLLAGRVDAVLLGDHGGARVQLPPSLRAALVQAEGTLAWAGLNCRDRNRVALEGELAGLAAVGVPGVHCVTGDHTSLGHRPDAASVFDLDSTRLAAAAVAAGLLTSVAENPVAPPVDRRAERLAQKAAAGARVCFVNHTSGPAALARFVTAARAACADLGTPADGRMKADLEGKADVGLEVEFVACVAVVVDPASAAVLRSFTGLELPPGYLDTILRADDVRATGISMAVDLARSLLAVPGVRGVNLSGAARPGAELEFAEVMAEITEQIRG